MTLNDVVALAHAGFSREQIMTLAQVAPQVAPQVAQQTAPQTVPSVAPQTVPSVAPQAMPQTGLTESQFAQLLQSVNTANATIDIPPTVSIDDKLAEHFTSMLVGENLKGGSK